MIPLPSSFPRFFKPLQPQSAKAVSSLSSGAPLSALFASYGALAKACLGQHRDVVTRMGLEADDVKELRDEMWALEDAYRVEEEAGDEEMGEDEE